MFKSWMMQDDELEYLFRQSSWNIEDLKMLRIILLYMTPVV